MLLKEDEFVILHVLLRVNLEVGSKFMQVEAVLIVAFLVIKEELAKL